MTRPSGGRASILGAQIVNDTYGTTVVLSAATAGSVMVSTGAIGIVLYNPNIAFRTRFNAAASTALTWPSSARWRADTEYAFPLNPGITNVSFISLVPSTVEVNWIIGAGA